MDGILLTATVLFSIVLATVPVALWLDARARRLEGRVVSAIVLRCDQGHGAGARSIRRPEVLRSTLGQLAFGLLRMPIGMRLAHVVPVWLVFVLAVVAGLAVGSGARFAVELPAACGLGAISAFFFARSVFGWELDRFQGALFRQLPDTIELVVSATRAGLPMTEAFRAVAREMPDPTRDEFHQATNAVAMGAPPDDALMQVYHRTRLAEYAIFAVTVAVHNRSGGRISESIQNLAETVRQRVSVAGRAQALSAEARLSARIMTVLPFVGGGLMTYMHPGYLAPLIDDPRGKHMLVVGATTLAIGAFAMRRLVNSVVRE